MRRRFFAHGAALAAFACLASSTITQAVADQMPRGFVHLRDIDPSIVQRMKYATRDNFVGQRLDGYNCGSCILARPVALALARVQADLAKQQLGLVVFDCYRPRRAVKMMISTMRKRLIDNAQFHPGLSGAEVIRQGYVAARSGHSSGGSVDLGLISLPRPSSKVLDMGTSFDFFHPRSHTRSREVSRTAVRNRRRLTQAMSAQGFANYAKEWWHFRYRAEPFRGQHFDFPIDASLEACSAPKS